MSIPDEKRWTFLGYIVLLISVGVTGWCAGFTVGLVSDGAPKENAAAAYQWAQSKYQAQIIGRPTSVTDLEPFGVVWWDESNAPAIPASFLEKQTVDAFLSYVEEGGGLLLSNLAFHYLFEMGVDAGEPRYFGADANSPLDWTDIQIAQGQENHPIFDGLKVENGIIQYDIQGWTDGSDFYTPNGPAGPNEGEVLAQVIDGYPQTNPLVEYHVKKGTIIAIGWVWSSWVINKDLEDVHGPLHANILDYLASRSAFAAMQAAGKLPLLWGRLKQLRCRRITVMESVSQ